MKKKFKKNKPKKTDSKEFAQEIHSRKRYAERYGAELSHETYLMLCHYLKKGLSDYPDGTIVTHVIKQSNRTTVKNIRARHICSEDIIAIYDKLRGTICTFLPPGCDENTIQWNIFDGEEDG